MLKKRDFQPAMLVYQTNGDLYQAIVSYTRDPRELCMFIVPDWCLSHVHELGKGTMEKNVAKKQDSSL